MTLPPHAQGDPGEQGSNSEPRTPPGGVSPSYPPQGAPTSGPAGQPPPAYPTSGLPYGTPIPGQPVYVPHYAVAPQPGPPPKRSKRGLFIALGVVVALLVICGGGIALIAGGGGDDEAGTPAEPAVEGENEPGEEAPPGIGEEARDGKFAFTVTGIDLGQTRIGDEVFAEEAQGVFAIIDITVENIGDVPQTFTDDEQRLFDSQGNEYSADVAADLLLNEGASAWLEEINPGNRIEVQLAFDVPNGTELTSMELHDSLFSNGVTVSLK